MADPVSATIARHALLTSNHCLACDVCCRFPLPTSPLAPFFSNAEINRANTAGLPETSFPPGRYGPGHAVLLRKEGAAFRCPAFRPTSNDCRIYNDRPLDCRLYPFMLMFDRTGRSVSLGFDTCCPAVASRQDTPELAACAQELADLLDAGLLNDVIKNSGIVTPWREHIRPLHELPRLTRALCRTDFGLARLTATVTDDLAHFFDAYSGRLSCHAFAPLAIWSGIFDIYWRVSGDRLLVFAQGDGDCFLIVPPMGGGDIRHAAAEALDIMRGLNSAGASPRIQEADDSVLSELVGDAWRLRDTHVEYLYDRAELAALPGNRYEKKRQLCNRFERDHEWRWRPFRPEDLPDAVTLYRTWLQRRCATHPEEFYVSQAEASFRTLYRALCETEPSGLYVRVLEADRRMAGIAVACPLHDGHTFSVLFEVSDLAVRGAAQFMYRELCREMLGFDLVNAGSASGLPNLERVKESYRPKARLRSHTLVPNHPGVT